MRCFFLNQKEAFDREVAHLIAGGTPQKDAQAAVRTDMPAPILEVQWQWFPHFIAVDAPMQNRLYTAWNKKWAGQEVTDGEVAHADEMHLWILDWIETQYPFVTGLLDYLKGIEQVEQAA
jgi:hypothetical protein